MKPEQDKEKKQTIGRKALDNLYSMTSLLLSVACCIALIHVELKIQEHHRLISHSIAYCDQMEKEILRKVRQNDGSWQPRHGRQKGSHSGRWHELEGKFLSYLWQQTHDEKKSNYNNLLSVFFVKVTLDSDRYLVTYK